MTTCRVLLTYDDRKREARCVLDAGHAGCHFDGDLMSWTTVVPVVEREVS